MQNENPFDKIDKTRKQIEDSTSINYIILSTFNNAVKGMLELAKKYPTANRIEIDGDRNAYLIFTRPETDEEMDIRIQTETANIEKEIKWKKKCQEKNDLVIRRRLLQNQIYEIDRELNK